MSNFEAFCIGHLPPRFEVPFSYRLLCPRSLGMPNELVIPDDRFGEAIDGASLAEYSQLFALADMIKNGMAISEYLYLFQYRKFISQKMNGGAPSTASWIRIVSGSEIEDHIPTNTILKDLTARVVVGSYLQLGESLASSYAKVHVVDDFVLFTASMASSGLFSESDITQFTTQTGMIPSPALTFVKTELFLKIMHILRVVWEHFSIHYAVKREGYQRRVSGYLLERLHSYLLCKWLMDGSEPDIGLWERYIVL